MFRNTLTANDMYPGFKYDYLKKNLDKRWLHSYFISEFTDCERLV